ncbi:MAG: type II toxin-antitoxin system VapC family toxin [Verrucomicrobiota bacterium]
MKTYADTSVLFSLYATDANSPKADAGRKVTPVPLPFTVFHRLELRNAMSLAVFQQRITPIEAQLSWQEVENDLIAGLLVPCHGPWHRIFQAAEQMAQNHTAVVGCRTLDIIHVASASVLGSTDFCTLDQRQLDLGRRLGLTVVYP